MQNKDSSLPEIKWPGQKVTERNTRRLAEENLQVKQSTLNCVLGVACSIRVQTKFQTGIYDLHKDRQ